MLELASHGGPGNANRIKPAQLGAIQFVCIWYNFMTHLLLLVYTPVYSLLKTLSPEIKMDTK